MFKNTFLFIVILFSSYSFAHSYVDELCMRAKTTYLHKEIIKLQIENARGNGYGKTTRAVYEKFMKEESLLGKKTMNFIVSAVKANKISQKEYCKKQYTLSNEQFRNMSELLHIIKGPSAEKIADDYYPKKRKPASNKK